MRGSSFFLLGFLFAFVAVFSLAGAQGVDLGDAVGAINEGISQADKLKAGVVTLLTSLLVIIIVVMLFKRAGDK